MNRAVMTGIRTGAVFLAVVTSAFADPGAGKPSPVPKAGDGIVYNAGGCPTGQMRRYSNGVAGPGSDCGTFDFDAPVIAEVQAKSLHNLHWICAVPFASCDAGGASRSMEIAE